MTLEYQAKQIAIAVNYYSVTFHQEISAVIHKPFESVLAAYHLAMVSQYQSETECQEPEEEAKYERRVLDSNKSGAPTRFEEMAVIPFQKAVQDDKTTTDLQNIINRFK